MPNSIRGLATATLLLAACADDQGGFYDHDADYLLKWMCEKFASDYREDRVANPHLCEGYDEEGWPIEGAAIALPEDI